MDVERPDLKRKKRRRRVAQAIVTGVVVVAIAIGLSTLKPAAPRVDRNSVWVGTVDRGTMLRQVRGVGSLVPEEIRWIAARTSGRIERILKLPGSWVEPDTVIMELSNPELLQEAQNSELQLKAAEALYISFKVQLEGDLLQLKSALAQLEAEFRQAALAAKINEELFAEGLVAELPFKQSQLRSQQLATQHELEMQRLAFRQESIEPQLAAQRSNVDQHQARSALLSSQVKGLTVRAGFSGVLQRLSVEEGMQINPGESLAQVANPKKLKAVIRVPEYQAKDVQIGQVAEIDTRTAVVKGKVVRVEPNVENGTVAVDVFLPGELPKGSRPDLTVEGRIELEVLTDVVFMGRPAFGRADSSASIFRFRPDSEEAERTQVNFGRTSVSTIEIVSGLSPGDRVILSDTSEWDDYDRIRVN